MKKDYIKLSTEENKNKSTEEIWEILPPLSTKMSASDGVKWREVNRIYHRGLNTDTPHVSKIYSPQVL